MELIYYLSLIISLISQMFNSPYQAYLAMSEKEREKFIDAKQQNDKDLPIPLGDHKYPEINFIDLQSTQEEKPIKLATYRNAPKNNPVGVVAIFHTLGLHSGLSGRLAQRLANEGFVAVAMDYRGHGRSEGERGYIDDYQLFVKDIHNFLKGTIKIYPKLPLFLFGNGLGAAICLYLCQTLKDIKISGLIIGSPSVARPTNNSVLNVISSIALKVMPNRTGLFEPDFSKVTKNKKVTKYLQEDKLIYHGKVMAGSVYQMLNILECIQEEHWQKLRPPPIAIIQGQCDKMLAAGVVIKFFKTLKTEDKELWYYKNLWTMFLLEEEYFEIQNRIISWLHKHI